MNGGGGREIEGGGELMEVGGRGEHREEREKESGHGEKKGKGQWRGG